jgi:hypothetical protein
MAPLRLTDDQLTAVFAAAQPLDPDVREGFLEALAGRLGQCRELGDGIVFRTIKEVQRQFWVPPRDTHVNLAPRKYRETSNAAKLEAARNGQRGGRASAG